MSDAYIGKCWQCGQMLAQLDYGREVDCSICGKRTRVCRNCRFFAPGRPNDCQEPMVTERVVDKQRANFCEFFEPTLTPLTARPGLAPTDLAQAAEALFRK